MKKLIFAAMFAFVLIFCANSYGAKVVLPDPNAKLSETVDIGPIYEQAMAIRPFEYQIRRGDNLTKLARIFGTTVEKLLAYNPNIKDKNLIFKGSKLVVPLYPTESLGNWRASINDNEDERTAKAYAKGQDSMFGSIMILGLGLLFFLVILIYKLLENNTLKLGIADAKTKNVDLSKKLWEAEDKYNVLAEELKHLNIQLAVAHDQLKLKEGADEEILRQKKENDRLVERVSALYMDKEMISVNLADARASIEAMERQLKLVPGQLLGLESQEHGKVLVKILKLEISKDKEGELDVFVECPKKDCLVNVAKNLKSHNALSHMANSGHWPES